MTVLSPCPGCGVLYPPVDERTHRYLGASAGCWSLWLALTTHYDPSAELLEKSKVPSSPAKPDTSAIQDFKVQIGDAYAVQHHGDHSPQAIQSVAVHLLTLHGIITGHTTSFLWPKERALRTKGAFEKLEPPPIGASLTIRHLYPLNDAAAQCTPIEYALSVYDAWMVKHRSTVERWYERYVVQ